MTRDGDPGDTRGGRGGNRASLQRRAEPEDCEATEGSNLVRGFGLLESSCWWQYRGDREVRRPGCPVSPVGGPRQLMPRTVAVGRELMCLPV